MSLKTERIESRLSVEEKALIAQAASLEGKSLSEFIISSARKAAKQTIQES